MKKMYIKPSTFTQDLAMREDFMVNVSLRDEDASDSNKARGEFAFDDENETSIWGD